MLITKIILPDGTVLSSGTGTVNAIQSAALTQSVNDQTELTLGSVCSNMLEATIIAPEGGLRLEAGMEVAVYKGDTCMGLFTLEKPTRSSANILKLTAYDRVSRLDQDLTNWLGGLVDWPYSLFKFAWMVCAQCGLELKNTEIPNGDYQVQQFSAQGITGRQLMQWVGQVAGRFCRATVDGLLEFAWYRNASVSLGITEEADSTEAATAVLEDVPRGAVLRPESRINPSLMGADSIAMGCCGKNLFLPASERNKIELYFSYNTDVKEYKNTDCYISVSANNWINPNLVTEFSLLENGFSFNSGNPAYGIGFPLEVKGGEMLTLSCKNSGNLNVRFGFFDENYALISFTYERPIPASVTTPSGTKVVLIVFTKVNVALEDSVSVYDVQVELGDTVTDYEAYQAEEYTVQLPQTVYGGSFDWNTGLLTVTWEKMTVTGSEWWWGLSFGSANERLLLAVDMAHPAQLLCNRIPFVADDNAAWAGTESVLSYGADGILRWYRPSAAVSTITDAESAISWLKEQYAAGTPVEICYQLAEPYTLQLEPVTVPALEGTNVLCSGTGDTAVSYRQLGYYQNALRYEDYAVAPIEKVQIHLTGEDVGAVYPDAAEGNTYAVTGNYLLTSDTTENLLPIAQALYEQLKGVTYVPCQVKVPANTELNAGDIVTVTDRNGVSISAYVMNKSRSGQCDTLKCTGNPSRDSSTAVNNQSYEALSGKVLNLRAEIEGLKVENRDASGKTASLALDVEGIKAEVTRQEVDSTAMKQQLTALEQNARQVQINVRSIQENGASKVTTQTGFTFDDTGLTVGKTNSELTNKITQEGMYVIRNDGTTMLQTDADGVIATDVSVRNYLIIGGHARFEDYADGTDDKRTACFFLGG